jgi:hypothetical protein
MATPIDVLDTAVKIGLGALISGIAAYLVAKLNHDRDIEKSRITRRRESLEDIAERLEKFYSCVLTWWSVAVARANAQESEPSRRDLFLDDWKKASELMNEGFLDAATAEAKLLLLGEKESQQLLRDYVNYISRFIRTNPKTASDLHDFQHNVLNKREAFFNKLSDVYKRT